MQRLETQPGGEWAGARPRAVASDGAAEVAAASLRELSGMLAVSRAVAAGGPLQALLDHIAAEAATVVGARSASILLLEGRDRFRLAGAHGLSSGYAALLAGAPTQLAPGHGPSGLAVAEGRVIAIDDTETDARFTPWRAVARREGYRALASVPLRSHADPLGALNVYRSRAEPWRRRQLLLLSFFGEHAASAIRTAQLIDRQTRQVAALTRVVRGQREQMHEHANRLHAIRGLLALDAHEDAERFVTTLEQAHHSAYGSVAERLHQQVVAGLVLAEIATAERRGITLELDPASHVERLPPGVTEPDVVTIVGNLLDNALDAVADVEPDRRRVRLTVVETRAALTVRVRDWGPGIAPGRRAEILRHGTSSKPGHSGVGLALVSDALRAAGGSLRIDGHQPGCEIEVALPFPPDDGDG